MQHACKWSCICKLSRQVQAILCHVKCKPVLLEACEAISVESQNLAWYDVLATSDITIEALPRVAYKLKPNATARNLQDVGYLQAKVPRTSCRPALL